MKRALSHLPPLVLEWSPNKVTLFDQATAQTTVGATIGACIKNSIQGRDAVIAISQRSAFVRSTTVPNVPKDEAAKVLSLSLPTLLPADVAEYATAFRLGGELRGRGRVAVVGAMKADALRRVHEECKVAGLRVHAVLPLAFGAWLAARAHSLTDCLVLSQGCGCLNLEVVSAAELRYSRAIPMPDSPDEIEDEIARTFDIAEVTPAPVLAAGIPGLAAEVGAAIADEKGPTAYLADVHAIDRLLFSFELPEKEAARRNRARDAAAKRAVAALAIAAACGVAAYAMRIPAISKQAAAQAAVERKERGLRQRQIQAETNLAQAKQASTFLDAAFAPAQTFSDVLTVLANAAPSSAWFTGITLERGRPLTVTGEGTSGQDIAGYVRKLSDEPRFKNLKLGYANKAVIGQKQVVRFSVVGYALGQPDPGSLAGTKAKE